jgi:hypothetical protein
MGSDNFLESQRWLAESDPQSFIRRISEPGHKHMIDQWETEKLVESLKKGEVYLFSESLSEEDWALTCVHKARSAEQAVLDSLAQSGDPHVAVIPEGPYVIPLYKT